MKNARHSCFAEFLTDSKELEKQLLRDNGPAVRQSHTPRETLMGYRIGEEVFEDFGLETETHPSDFLAVGDITEDHVLSVYRDSPEDAYNRMIDHYLARSKTDEEAVDLPDDIEALVERYHDRVEQEEADLAKPTAQEPFTPFELMEFDIDRICFGSRH